MARPTRLKKEIVNGASYWIAWVNDRKRSFGNAAKVSKPDAMQRLADAMKGGPVSTSDPVLLDPREINVGKLIDDYLEWLPKHTVPENVASRRSMLNKFVRWSVTRKEKKITVKVPVATLPVMSILPSDFADFIDELRGQVKPTSLWHYYTGLKACWNWGAGTKKHPASHLPPDHRPFKNLAAPPRSTPGLRAEELPTPAEIELMLERAKGHGLDDLLTVLMDTGCRPGELAKARVENFDSTGQQIVLYTHKTMNSSSSKKPRQIFLPPTSLAIVKRLCASRPSPRSHIFMGPGAGYQPRYRKPDINPELEATVRAALATGESPTLIASRLGIPKIKVQRIQRGGKPFPSEIKQRDQRRADRHAEGRRSAPAPWTVKRIGKVFRLLRGDGVREHHVIYSFRHLFITHAIRAGVAIFMVAKAVGTSTKMIEQTYGHFAQTDLANVAGMVAAARAVPPVVLTDTLVPVPVFPTAALTLSS